MAYRISYGVEKEYQTTGIAHTGRTIILSMICAAIFLALAYRCWPEGAAVMERLRSYGGWTNTKMALEGMALELRNGTSLPDAVSAFCQDVLGRCLSVGA